MSYSSLEPTENSSEGLVDVISTNIFGMYGVSDKINLRVRLPYIWRKNKSNGSTETVSGIGDINFGLRTIISNKIVGPGNKVFLDASIYIPTADSFSENPLDEDMDMDMGNESHDDFAMGTGQYSAALGLEYWMRSEFPWVIGVSGELRQPLNTSDGGFKPGRKMRVDLHLIRQKPIIKQIHPYIKFSLRHADKNQWDGEKSPNSGGVYLDGFAQMDFELNERASLILSAGLPIWEDINGSQLRGISGSVSLRVTK